MDDELIDHVQNCGEDEHFSYILPTLSHQLATVVWIKENCPEKRRPVLICVSQPRPDRENSSNSRLDDQSKIHWSSQSADQVLPYPSQYLAHEPIALLPVSRTDSQGVSCSGTKAHETLIHYNTSNNGATGQREGGYLQPPTAFGARVRTYFSLIDAAPGADAVFAARNRGYDEGTTQFWNGRTVGGTVERLDCWGNPTD